MDSYNRQNEIFHAFMLYFNTDPSTQSEIQKSIEQRASNTQKLIDYLENNAYDHLPYEENTTGHTKNDYMKRFNYPFNYPKYALFDDNVEEDLNDIHPEAFRKGLINVFVNAESLMMGLDGRGMFKPGSRGLLNTRYQRFENADKLINALESIEFKEYNVKFTAKDPKYVVEGFPTEKKGVIVSFNHQEKDNAYYWSIFDIVSDISKQTKNYIDPHSYPTALLVQDPENRKNGIGYNKWIYQTTFHDKFEMILEEVE